MYNVGLAIIPVVLGFVMLKIKSRRYKIIIGAIWLAFLPNTIYMLTDINHLLEQWNLVTNTGGKTILVSQYALLMILAVITFIAAQYPFEKIIKKDFKLDSFSRIIVLIVIDFFVAFGVILGGIERVNSWELITNPKSVIENVSTLFHSGAQVSLIIGFGGLFSIIYFSFRDASLRFFKYLKKI